MTTCRCGDRLPEGATFCPPCRARSPRVVVLPPRQGGKSAALDAWERAARAAGGNVVFAQPAGDGGVRFEHLVGPRAHP